ncbi:MAG: transcription elongation factor subunit Spt4 [Candidatus Pacearchaeota archaeon]
MKLKIKVCNNCKNIYSGDKCPLCGETSYSESYKGEVEIFNPEKSSVAKTLEIKSSGKFAIKIS